MMVDKQADERNEERGIEATERQAICDNLIYFIDKFDGIYRRQEDDCCIMHVDFVVQCIECGENGNADTLIDDVCSLFTCTYCNTSMCLCCKVVKVKRSHFSETTCNFWINKNQICKSACTQE